MGDWGMGMKSIPWAGGAMVPWALAAGAPSRRAACCRLPVRLSRAPRRRRQPASRVRRRLSPRSPESSRWVPGSVARKERVVQV